jgi:hypothetical protein
MEKLQLEHQWILALKKDSKTTKTSEDEHWLNAETWDKL